MPSKDKKSTPIGVMTRQLAMSEHGLQYEWFETGKASKDRTQSIVLLLINLLCVLACLWIYIAKT